MNRNLKIAAKIALFYSPEFIRKRVAKSNAKHEIARALTIAHRTTVTQDEIADALNHFSFDSDIMLHSSLVNIGKIKGGAKGTTNTIINKIDISQHTLLISALPYRGNFASWLKEDWVFDVRTAPIAMGAINERIANMKEAYRSIHPTHSVVAIGAKAKEYTCEHHMGQTPFSSYSPYYKLIKNHGKVLLFGTKLNNMTLVHAIEDMLGEAHPVKVYEKKQYDIKCIDYNGNSLIVHTPVHSRFQGLFRDGMRMYETLVESDAIKSVKIGESEISMVDCYGYTMTYLGFLASGRSIYGTHHVTNKLLQKIEEVKMSLM